MHYFAIYKPYLMLSQFLKTEEHHRTLLDLYDFPKDVYAIGRLDNDSEGLLLLTNDNYLKTELLSPTRKVQKTYYVQVEGIPSEKELQQLAQGVEIKLEDKMYLTKPCVVKRLTTLPKLPERVPPIRFRENIPTTWVSVTLEEGKNRQIRKMFAKIQYPVLRLVRYAIHKYNIDKMNAGDVLILEKSDVYRFTGVTPLTKVAEAAYELDIKRKRSFARKTFSALKKAKGEAPNKRNKK